MTWTYTPDFSGNRDKIRLMIGDTDTTDQLLTDEVITYAVTQQSDLHMAAARCCDYIVASLARKVNVSTGGISVDVDARMEQYSALAAILREQRDEEALLGGTIKVGGTTTADIEALDEDESLQQPQFKQGQFDNNTDNPGTDSDEE